MIGYPHIGWGICTMVIAINVWLLLLLLWAVFCIGFVFGAWWTGMTSL